MHVCKVCTYLYQDYRHFLTSLPRKILPYVWLLGDFLSLEFRIQNILNLLFFPTKKANCLQFHNQVQNLSAWKQQSGLNVCVYV